FAGATSIDIPSDGTGSGGNTPVNGIAAGDTIIIGGTAYTVDTMVANPTGTSTINLTSGLAAGVSVGDGIYEYKSFTTNVSDVGVRDTGSTFRLDLRTTVTSDTAPNPVFTFDVDVNIVAIDIKKYVRETSGACTTPGCLGANTTSYDNGSGSHTYYDAGVTAAPGETLEYLLVVTTSTASITTAVVTDVLPDFTSYVSNSTTLNAIAVDDEAVAPVFPLDAGADDGGLLVDDNGARTVGTEGTGAVGTTTNVYVTYQVQVD
ncbi:MAG: hypothetical protein KDI19_05045, partial [Pseudomonadales bacterium]|nr:hypothetical protein [Pseudomonadales bacterium]